jgi:hypothetical protein
MQIDDIEKARAARRAENEKLRDVQAEIDERALFDLEGERGEHAVDAVRLERFVPGLTTLLVVAGPTPDQHKRFRQQLHKGDRIDAMTMLAGATVLYPPKDTVAKIYAAFPQAEDAVAMAAIGISEGKAKH